MLYIGICDDENIHRELIKKACERFFEGISVPHQYICFCSCTEILDYHEYELAVLLLDIEMPEGINGLELMRRIQKNVSIRSIIFVSGYIQYIFDSFSPKTLGFCPKPLDDSRLFPLLQSAIDKSRHRPIIFKNDASGIFYEDDIIYICAEGHYINIYTSYMDTPALLVTDIRDAEKLLSDTGIIRTHRSFMVNLAYVKRLSQTRLTLTHNGMELPIGRSYLQNVRRAYKEYLQTELLPDR